MFLLKLSGWGTNFGKGEPIVLEEITNLTADEVIPEAQKAWASPAPIVEITTMPPEEHNEPE